MPPFLSCAASAGWSNTHIFIDEAHNLPQLAQEAASCKGPDAVKFSDIMTFASEHNAAIRLRIRQLRGCLGPSMQEPGPHVSEADLQLVEADLGAGYSATLQLAKLVATERLEQYCKRYQVRHA
jgi:hypothetical protein